MLDSLATVLTLRFTGGLMYGVVSKSGPNHGLALSGRQPSGFAKRKGNLLFSHVYRPNRGMCRRLPRTNPGNRLQYKRVNIPYKLIKLIMIAGGDNKLSFGNVPRLLLAPSHFECEKGTR